MTPAGLTQASQELIAALAVPSMSGIPSLLEMWGARYGSALLAEIRRLQAMQTFQIAPAGRTGFGPSKAPPNDEPRGTP